MFTAVVDFPTPPFWLATARTRRVPFAASWWIRKVTRAFLAAASGSRLGSCSSSSIETPCAIWVVSRETSTPASAAALVTASRTAIAASSSMAPSSCSCSIPSPPPTDVSRETSTFAGAVDASRTSTSSASARVAVEMFAGLVVALPVTAAVPGSMPESSRPMLAACPSTSGTFRDPRTLSESPVVRSTTVGELVGSSSTSSDGALLGSDLGGATPDCSGCSCPETASSSSADGAACPSAGSSPAARTEAGEGTRSLDSCRDSDAVLSPADSMMGSGSFDTAVPPVPWSSEVRLKRRGQVGSGWGGSSSSGDPSSVGSRRSARSDGSIPGGQAIGSAGSFQGTCSPPGSSGVSGASLEPTASTSLVPSGAASGLAGGTSSEPLPMDPSFVLASTVAAWSSPD